jgi:hypothetical protein
VKPAKPLNFQPAKPLNFQPAKPLNFQPAMPRKKKIAAALREQVWIGAVGQQFSAKCTVSWCSNPITVFNFQCGHVLAESKGGPTTLENLRPICGRCNQSMATMHMDDWDKLGGKLLPTGKAPTATAQSNGCLNWLRRLFDRLQRPSH